MKDMKAGYAGKDAMRSEAQKAFKSEDDSCLTKPKGDFALKKGGMARGKQGDTQKAYQAKNGKGKYGYGGALGAALGGLGGGALGSLAGGMGGIPGAMAGIGIGREIGEALPFKKGGKGQKKATGGKMDEKCSGGSVEKMAEGGIGKIRLKQATPSGKPISRRGKSMSSAMGE